MAAFLPLPWSEFLHTLWISYIKPLFLFYEVTIRRCLREGKNGSVRIKAGGTECISDPAVPLIRPPDRAPPLRIGRGAVILPLPVDAKKVWLEDRGFATRPPEKLSVEKSRIETATAAETVCGGLFPHKQVLFEGQMSKC